MKIEKNIPKKRCFITIQDENVMDAIDSNKDNPVNHSSLQPKQITQSIGQCIAQGMIYLYFDLSQINKVNSSLIGIILYSKALTEKFHGQIYISACPAQLHPILRSLDLEEFIHEI